MSARSIVAAGVMALAWGAGGLAACASGGGAVRGDAGGDAGIVRFTNTTASCSRPVRVEVAVGSARVEVAPGETVRLVVAPEPTSARISPAGEPAVELERQVWGPAEGAAVERYFGCVAPEFLAPGRGRATLEIAYPAWGCVPGRRGPALLSVGGRPLAQLAPGAGIARSVPIGALSVRTEGDGAGVAAREVFVGEGGAALTVGCSAAEVGGPRVAVLAVLGPGPRCPRGASRALRAAGVVATLGPGEAYTLVLAPGRHRLEVRDGQGPEETLWLDLGPGATIVEAPACAE